MFVDVAEAGVDRVVLLCGEARGDFVPLAKLHRVLPVEHDAVVFHERCRSAEGTWADRFIPTVLSAENHATVESRNWCEIREHRRELVAFLFRVVGIVGETVAGRPVFANEPMVRSANRHLPVDLAVEPKRISGAGEIIVWPVVLRRAACR